MSADIELKDRDPISNDSQPRETRLTLRLSPEAKESLDWLATERNTTYGEVIRRALGTERFFLEAQRRNASVLIEEPNKRVKEVLLR